MNIHSRTPAVWPRVFVASLMLLSVGALGAWAQDAAGLDPDALAEAALADPPPAPEAAPPQTSVELLEMAWPSRWLLAPILLLSVIVVAVAVERLLGLRRARVVPRPLARRLQEQIKLGDSDPATTAEVCERYPSAAASVVKALLAKVGRPQPELEAAASEEVDRQADRLYANVRTLNLAAAVAPLMGLLGTVWGMIQAFFVTARLPIEANKGQALAEGIYTALFTTFAGLAVAIPAAVLAHYFEGRILRLMRRVEQLTSGLLPQLERYEGQRAAMRSFTAERDSLGGALRVDPAWSNTAGNQPAPTADPYPPAPSP